MNTPAQSNPNPRRWRSGPVVILANGAALLCLVLWAHFSDIEEVSHAQGQVIARARTQVIQSANDGVIEALLVREGDQVRRGQLLVQLERKQAAAAVADSHAKVAALKAALVRLQAEVLGRPLVFSEEIKRFPVFVANQTELYRRRSQAVNEEIEALETSGRLVNEELELNKPLLQSGDVGRTDIIRLQRQAADIQGAITNRRNRFFQEAQVDMTKAEEDLATQEQILAERKAVLERTDIRAPMDGMVRKIELTTRGAKVRPGEVVMELLPTDDVLVVEAKLRTADMAYVRVGLPASVKLDAYDYSIFGSLNGKVTYVSPDALTEDSRAGQQIYYRTQIAIDANAIAKAKERGRKEIEIQPGMTASVDIRTGSKSVLSYITKPITKTLSESLRER